MTASPIMAGIRSEMMIWGCCEAWATCARSDSEMGLKWSGICQNSDGFRQPFEHEILFRGAFLPCWSCSKEFRNAVITRLHRVIECFSSRETSRRISTTSSTMKLV